jgi:hypothetical protein
MSVVVSVNAQFPGLLCLPSSLHTSPFQRLLPRDEIGGRHQAARGQRLLRVLKLEGRRVSMLRLSAGSDGGPE